MRRRKWEEDEKEEITKVIGCSGVG